MSGIGAFFKSVLGICETQPLDDGLWQVEGDKITVKLSQVKELSQAGSAVYLKGSLKPPVLILRGEDNAYYAYASRCTHGGRKLDPGKNAGTLRCCSLNHSTFDLEGKPLSGPAKDKLTKYDAKVSGKDLLITIKAA